jgi:tRNA (guanine-N1)-methyltransferase
MSLQLDVFTLVPHAFGWLTERRPLAAVLGTELDLRLFSYRDTTPLRAGQVDDEPYGGGAGMVLRVDVVAANLPYLRDDDVVLLTGERTSLAFEPRVATANSSRHLTARSVFPPRRPPWKRTDQIRRHSVACASFPPAR